MELEEGPSGRGAPAEEVEASILSGERGTLERLVEAVAGWMLAAFEGDNGWRSVFDDDGCWALLQPMAFSFAAKAAKKLDFLFVKKFIKIKIYKKMKL